MWRVQSDWPSVAVGTCSGSGTLSPSLLGTLSPRRLPRMALGGLPGGWIAAGAAPSLGQAQDDGRRGLGTRLFRGYSFS